MRRIAAIALLCACSSLRSATANRPVGSVLDEDYVRVPQQLRGPVYQAQAWLGDAQPELERAESRARQARREADLARAGEAAAAARVDEAQARLASARHGGDERTIADAVQLLRAAQLQRQVAAARFRYSRDRAAERGAEAAVAARRADLMRARVELAKVEALQLSAVPTAQMYDPAVFRRRVASAISALEDARARAGDERSRAQDSLDRWREVDRRFLVQGGPLRTHRLEPLAPGGMRERPAKPLIDNPNGA